jgi:capsid protein
MEILRYGSQYLEAVLIGARVAACFSGFVKTNNPIQAKKSLEDGDVPGKSGAKLTKLQPGTLSYLRPNEDITFATPNRPSDNFDSFLLRLNKFVSMSIRIPYAMMFLDLSEVNYSSWKGGSIEVKRNINRWRESLNSTLTWILKTYILEGAAKGFIKGKLANIKLSIRFPKFEVIDEEKTARANRLDLENKITSKRRIADEGGKDFEELQRELDEEMEIETKREAERLLLQKELSEELGIVFLDDPMAGQVDDRERGSEFTEDEKIDRRKDDGNW